MKKSNKSSFEVSLNSATPNDTDVPDCTLQYVFDLKYFVSIKYYKD